MQRIDGERVSDTLQVPITESAPGYFKRPEVGIEGTQVTADWANSIQEEIASVIESLGTDLDVTDRTQLLDSINTIVDGNFVNADLTIYLDPAGSDSTGDGTSGSPWYSINKAFEYLSGKVIKADASVDILLGNGTYDWTETQTIDHPNGDRIRVIGGGSSVCTVKSTTVGTGDLIDIARLSNLKTFGYMTVEDGEMNLLGFNDVTIVDLIMDGGLRGLEVASHCNVSFSGISTSFSNKTFTGLNVSGSSVSASVDITGDTVQTFAYFDNCIVDMEGLEIAKLSASGAGVTFRECQGKVNNIIANTDAGFGGARGVYFLNSNIYITSTIETRYNSGEGILSKNSKVSVTGGVISSNNGTDGIGAEENTDFRVEGTSVFDSNTNNGISSFDNSRVVIKDTLTVSNNGVGVDASENSYTSTPTGATFSGNTTDATPARFTGNTISYGNSLSYNYHI